MTEPDEDVSEVAVQNMSWMLAAADDDEVSFGLVNSVMDEGAAHEAVVPVLFLSWRDEDDEQVVQPVAVMLDDPLLDRITNPFDDAEGGDEDGEGAARNPGDGP